VGSEPGPSASGPNPEAGEISDPRQSSGSVPTSVFVILMDTLRADSFLTTADATPPPSGLRRLLRDSVVFGKAFAPSSWTRTSVATLLTGLAPHAHRVYGRLHKLDEPLTTLAESMRAGGYATFAWSTNPNILPLWGFDQGFDEFVGVSWDEGKPDADDVLDSVEQLVAARPSTPAFYYIHLMDPHNPYAPDPRILAQVKRSRAVRVRRIRGSTRKRYAEYVADVVRMERRLGEFVDFLVERGLYHDALIVLVSDHGEEFKEHGRFRHGKTLYEEVLRVPLILKLPGNRLGGTYRSEVAGLADVMPTLLEEVGLPRPPGLRGRSLVSPSSVDPPVIGTLEMEQRGLDSVSDGGWKLIRRKDGPDELYELTTDPGEHHNRIHEMPDRAAALREILDAQYRLESHGWYVLGCPGSGDEVLRFALRTDGVVEPMKMEEDDRLATPTEGEVRVAMRVRGGHLEDVLAPRRAAKLDPDRLDEILSDRDGVVLRDDGGAAVLEAVDGQPLRYRLGSSERISTGDRVVLEEARVDAMLQYPARVGCPPPGEATRDAYLSLWYVPRPAAVGRGQVADELVERLEALGYQW